MAGRGIEHDRLALVRHVGPRATMGAMVWQCCRLSRRRLIFQINDDVVFRTAGWDRAMRETLDRFDDGVALAYGNDLHQEGRVPSFPILPRTTCDLLGGVCPEEYRHHYIDSHLHDIFLQLRRLGHDRLAYRGDVVFEHLHAEAGKADPQTRYDTATAAEDEDDLPGLVRRTEGPGRPPGPAHRAVQTDMPLTDRRGGRTMTWLPACARSSIG